MVLRMMSSCFQDQPQQFTPHLSRYTHIHIRKWDDAQCFPSPQHYDRSQHLQRHWHGRWSSSVCLMWRESTHWLYSTRNLLVQVQHMLTMGIWKTCKWQYEWEKKIWFSDSLPWHELNNSVTHAGFLKLFDFASKINLIFTGIHYTTHCAV